MSSASKKKVILDRLKRLEDETAKGHEQLESPDHADRRGFRPLFWAIAAVAAIGFVAVYVTCQHASKIVANQQTSTIASRPSGSEMAFRIVTRSGQPVVGAVVSARHFYTVDPEKVRQAMRGVPANSVGQFAVNENIFPPDKIVFPRATTDAHGIARIVIPDDETLSNAGYPAARAEMLRENLRQPSISVRLHVDHPDHPRWEDHANPTIVLEDSSSIVVRARQGDDPVPARNLFPMLGASFWNGIDASDSEEVLTIRRVDLASKDASRWLRIVYVPDDGPAWFSELVDLTKQTGPTISLDLDLKPGVRVKGRLSEEVPRPVENGWAVAETVRGTIRPGDWCWTAAAEIESDGTFVLESLPEGEHLEIVALCDGWISQSHTSDEIKAYAKQTGFSAPRYDESLSANGPSVLPRLYHLDAAVIEMTVPMAQTSAAQVTVVDEAGRPIPNARVRFSSNQRWSRGGNHVGGGIDMLSLLRAELASGKRRTTAIPFVPTDDDMAGKRQRSRLVRTGDGEWKIENVLRFSATTDAKGVAVIPNLPSGSKAQATGRRESGFRFGVDHDEFVLAAPSIKGPLRDWSTVDIVPGQTATVTVPMKQRGAPPRPRLAPAAIPGMGVVFTVLAASYAAACVWLTLRIANGRQRRPKLIAGLMAAPILYALSFGPMASLGRHGVLPGFLMNALGWFYEPLIVFLNDAPAPVSAALNWYSLLWP